MNIKRNKYLGFNDFWFSIIGILILGLCVVFIFKNPSDQLTTIEIVITWIIDLLFSTCPPRNQTPLK